MLGARLAMPLQQSHVDCPLAVDIERQAKVEETAAVTTALYPSNACYACRCGRNCFSAFRSGCSNWKQSPVRPTGPAAMGRQLGRDTLTLTIDINILLHPRHDLFP